VRSTGEKTSRVHGTIERTTGMLGVRSAVKITLLPDPPLSAAAFQLRRVSATNPSPKSFPPEPEIRNGLSLARDDGFSTITRSTLPTCSFASTPENPRKPVRSGRLARTRDLRCLPALPQFSRPPLPFGSLEPSGSKRSNRFRCRKPATAGRLK
jgi:hypothetical protein